MVHPLFLHVNHQMPQTYVTNVTNTRIFGTCWRVVNVPDGNLLMSFSSSAIFRLYSSLAIHHDYVEHLGAGRSSRHDCHHQGRQVRASQTPDSLHVHAPQLEMIRQTRLRRLYVSELPGERTCHPMWQPLSQPPP